MGRSTVTYAGHCEWFSDSDLWVLRHFLLAEANRLDAKENTKEARAAAVFFEGWEWHGPGVFCNAELDTFFYSPEIRCEILLRVLAAARERIAAFGDVIPLSYLQANLDRYPLVEFLAPQFTNRYCSDIDRIIALLHREPLVTPPRPAFIDAAFPGTGADGIQSRREWLRHEVEEVSREEHARVTQEADAQLLASQRELFERGLRDVCERAQEQAMRRLILYIVAGIVGGLLIIGILWFLWRMLTNPP